LEIKRISYRPDLVNFYFLEAAASAYIDSMVLSSIFHQVEKALSKKEVFARSK
jgi:hypothetical protein